MRRLRAHPDGVRAGAGFVLGRRAARLHRRRDQPLVDEPLPHDDVGLRETAVGSVAVTAFPVHHDVARGGLVDLRRSRLGRALGVDHCVERLPVDLDQLERVLGRLAGLGDDRRDARARERNLVDLERSRGHDMVLGAGGLPGARERVQVLEVAAGEDADHAGARRRTCRVDAPDARVRVRRAKDRDVRHSRQLEIVEVLRGARDQPGVLDPLDRRADEALPELGRHLAHLPAAAASPTALTMLW